MALNSLADDKLQATVRCLAPHGQLLEIGKYDILKNTPLGMRPLHNNISFQGIDLDSLFKGVMRDQVRPAHRNPARLRNPGGLFHLLLSLFMPCPVPCLFTCSMTCW